MLDIVVTWWFFVDFFRVFGTVVYDVPHFDQAIHVSRHQPPIALSVYCHDNASHCIAKDKSLLYSGSCDLRPVHFETFPYFKNGHH